MAICGFVGIFGEGKLKKRAYRSLLKARHRGGDFRFKTFEKGILGANPLLLEGEGGLLKANEDRTIFAVLDGEIFNREELKKELTKKGHRLGTRSSSSEILVHLYEQFGPEMLGKIDSEIFSFIIYDKNNDTIFAARDPLGAKPLHYASDRQGRFYFASELKQLVGFDDIAEVFEVPAGSYFFKGRIRRYFNLKLSSRIKNENLAVRSLRHKLVSAVKKRVETNLPVGVLLSGGVDSSLIMEIAGHFNPNVTAIILGTPDSEDAKYAVRFCRERGYKYHLIGPVVNFHRIVKKIIYQAESYEPGIIYQGIATEQCAEAAKKLGINICLSGEGADSLFCGFNEYIPFCTEKKWISRHSSSFVKKWDPVIFGGWIEWR